MLMVTKHLDGRHVAVTHETVTVRRPGEPTEHRALRDGELSDLAGRARRTRSPPTSGRPWTTGSAGCARAAEGCSGPDRGLSEEGAHEGPATRGDPLVPGADDLEELQQVLTSLVALVARASARTVSTKRAKASST